MPAYISIKTELGQQLKADQGIVIDLLFCAHTSNRINASLVALVPSSTSRDYIKILGGK